MMTDLIESQGLVHDEEEENGESKNYDGEMNDEIGGDENEPEENEEEERNEGEEEMEVANKEDCDSENEEERNENEDETVVAHNADLDSENERLHIDESSPPKAKLPKLDMNVNGQQGSDGALASPSSAELKPIQVVLNRAKPGCHSTQTRYGTRTRSDSLPPKVSRYSPDDAPFACDTKMSLIDLANKLAAADRKVNGKRGLDKKAVKPLKPVPPLNKATMMALKKKIQSISTEEEEAEVGTRQLTLPAALIDPNSSAFHGSNGLYNGVDRPPPTDIMSPEVLSNSKYQVVKVDLFPKTPEKSRVATTVTPQKPAAPKPLFLNNDKVRAARKSLEHAQKQEQMLAEAKRREMECVRQLEAHRAKEKQQSEEASKFNSLVYEFYDDVSKFMDLINTPPSDSAIHNILPKPDGLPVWPLLSATTAKEVTAETAFDASIENAILEGSPEKKDRKKEKEEKKEAEEETEPSIEGNTNVSSGVLGVPDPLESSHLDAIMEKAVNHVLRNKIPKFARRGFEAAKYAAETGKKHVLLVEEARKERLARGFAPPGVKPHHIYGSQTPSPRPVGRPPKLLSRPPLISNGPSKQPASKPDDDSARRPDNLAPSQLSLLMQTTPPQQQKLQVNPAAIAYVNAPTSRSDSPSDMSRRHKCPECEYTTDNRSHLRRHVGSVHSDVKLFSCYVCSKEFARGEKCKAHIEREHPEVVYDYRRIRRHTIQLPPDTRVKTDPAPLDLSKSAPEVEESRSESKAQEFGILPAKHAHMAESGAYEVKGKEQKTNGKDSSFACPQCGYLGRDSWHLQRHLSEVHAAVRSLKCGICSYSTGRKHRMVSHMKKHGELFCFYCDFSTINSSLFNAHLKLCTNIYRANMLTCDRCQRMYSNRKQLQNHLSKEHQIEMFFCDLCPYSTTDFQQFERHSETHFSGDIESQCMKCNEIFDKTDDLMEHNKSCSGTSPSPEADDNTKLKCSMCSFSTVSAQAMKLHLDMHTEEKLTCEIEECTFTARSQHSMDQHMKYKHKIDQQKPQQTTSPKPAVMASAQPPSSAVSASTLLSTAAFAAANAVPPGALPGLQALSLPTIPIVAGIPVYSHSIQPVLQLQQQQFMQQQHREQQLKQLWQQEKLKLREQKRLNKLKVNQIPTKQHPVYQNDDDSGGLKGHGSGTFVCPYCTDRPPFKYRRSYEKHMYKHEKDGTGRQGGGAMPQMRCPFAHCQTTFTSSSQIQQHVATVHGVKGAFGGPMTIPPGGDRGPVAPGPTGQAGQSRKRPWHDGEVIDLDSSPEKDPGDDLQFKQEHVENENSPGQFLVENKPDPIEGNNPNEDHESYMYTEGVDLDNSFAEDDEDEDIENQEDITDPHDNDHKIGLKMTISRQMLQQRDGIEVEGSSSDGEEEA